MITKKKNQRLKSKGKQTRGRGKEVPHSKTLINYYPTTYLRLMLHLQSTINCGSTACTAPNKS